MSFETRIVIDTDKSRKQTFFDVEVNELFINESKEYCIKISEDVSNNNTFNINQCESLRMLDICSIERIPSSEQELFTLTLRKN